MTADELATLAKVERLLAEAETSPYDAMFVWRNRVARSRDLLRGLLAEPQQPSDDLPAFQQSLTEALNAHGVPAMSTWRAAIDWLAEHGGHGLAEPQVNPSEAKELERECISYFMALERIRERCRQNQPENGAAAFAFNESRRVLEEGFQLRAEAGLLAEGEESREP